jgi:hypothetical protein
MGTADDGTALAVHASARIPRRFQTESVWNPSGFRLESAWIPSILRARAPAIPYPYH